MNPSTFVPFVEGTGSSVGNSDITTKITAALPVGVMVAGGSGSFDGSGGRRQTRTAAARRPNRRGSRPATPRAATLRGRKRIKDRESSS
jgi:hypothetical protein